MKRIILLGGGLDSTTLLVYLSKRYADEPLYGLHINYGQKAFIGERESVKYFCNKYKVNIAAMNMDLTHLIHSPLIDKEMAVNHNKNNLHGRNIAFISLAAIYGCSLLTDSENSVQINVGFHIEPKDTGFPDATDSFLQSMNNTLKEGILVNVEVVAPFREYTRTQIFKMGYDLDPEVITKSFTCYESTNTEECGKCTHCQQKRIMRKQLSL